MGAFSLLIIIYIFDLLTCATELPCLSLTSKTASLSSGFSHAFVMFCLDAPQLIVRLALKTRIEN